MKYDSDYIDNFMKEVQKLPNDVVEIKRNFYKNFQEKDFSLLENKRNIFDWASKQTYISLANMMTSASQIGIDSCPIEGFNKDKVEKLLEGKNILDKNKFGVSCMVAFGYRENEPEFSKTRQSIDNIVK